MAFNELIQKLRKLSLLLVGACIVVSMVIFKMIYIPELGHKTNTPSEMNTNVSDLDDDAIVNGIHVRTGLKDSPGLIQVVRNCTNCHSSKLLTQNRMDYDSWKTTIDWMQETQNLWDLGDNEEIIINYLVTNYPIIKKSRRQQLKDIEWYTLK